MQLPYFLPLLLFIYPLSFFVQDRPSPTYEAPLAAVRTEIFYGQPLVWSQEEMVKGLDVPIYPEDMVRIFPDPRLGLGGKITIFRATPVWIDDGGRKFLVRTFKKRVGEVLEEKNITLGVQDKLKPGLEVGVLEEGTISITRVEETEVIEKRSIPFQSITKDSPDVYACSTATERVGKKGTAELKYKVRRENGVEVSRTLVSEKIVIEPVDEIILTGSKTPSLYQAGTATWYRHPRITGNFAAHKTLPFGTKVLVKSAVHPSKIVCVTINDRGPWDPLRVIDLQPSPFSQLAPLGAGLIYVTLHVIP